MSVVKLRTFLRKKTYHDPPLLRFNHNSYLSKLLRQFHDITTSVTFLHIIIFVISSRFADCYSYWYSFHFEHNRSPRIENYWSTRNAFQNEIFAVRCPVLLQYSTYACPVADGCGCPVQPTEMSAIKSLSKARSRPQETNWSKTSLFYNVRTTNDNCPKLWSYTYQSYQK